MANTYIQIRTNEKDKKEATAILNELGTNLSTVLNMTIKQIILKRRIPFDIELPADPAVENVAASMRMENMTLTQEELNQLHSFRHMTKEEQEADIHNLVESYTQKAKLHG